MSKTVEINISDKLVGDFIHYSYEIVAPEYTRESRDHYHSRAAAEQAAKSEAAWMDQLSELDFYVEDNTRLGGAW